MPEFIFYKNGKVGFYKAKKFVGIFRLIEGQVHHMVGSRIVFPDFITGRGKERKHYFNARIVFTDRFYNRAALLEFA